jgi:nucleoside-diphosphate-sugar epimerase
MKTALVTGATGMLGSYLVERLDGDGWNVRALVRDVRSAAWLEGMGAEPVEGDLADASAVRASVRGCDVVFHAGGAVGAGGDPRLFHVANVRGTENVVAAASSASARVVHVSSTAVYGERRYHPVPTDESFALPELPAWDVYGRSKQDAERVVLDAQRAGRVWAAVVRPPIMYGRRDRQFVPRVAPVLERGIFPLIAGGRTTLPIVHAGAVAEGAVLAGACDAADGRVYLLTRDFDVTAAELVRYAAEGLGRGVSSPSLPVWLGRLGFCALGAGLALVGRGELSVHAAGTFRMLTRGNPFTAERAHRELGWAPRVPPAVGIPEAFRWWVETRASLSTGKGR